MSSKPSFHKPRSHLLSATHSTGSLKARWFSRRGFTLAAWQELAEALKGHAANHQVASTQPSPFGRRYVVEGVLLCPDGSERHLRTVWFIEADEDTPRFVTAYPLRQGT